MKANVTQKNLQDSALVKYQTHSYCCHTFLPLVIDDCHLVKLNDYPNYCAQLVLS